MKDFLIKLLSGLVSAVAVYLNSKYPFLAITPEVQLWVVGILTWALTTALARSKWNPAGIANEKQALNQINEISRNVTRARVKKDIRIPK